VEGERFKVVRREVRDDVSILLVGKGSGVN